MGQNFENSTKTLNKFKTCIFLGSFEYRHFLKAMVRNLHIYFYEWEVQVEHRIFPLHKKELLDSEKKVLIRYIWRQRS